MIKPLKSYVYNLSLNGSFAPIVGQDLNLKEAGLFLGKTIIGIVTPDQNSLNAPIELPPGAVLLPKAEINKICLSLKNQKGENACYFLPLSATVQPATQPIKKLYYEVDFKNVDLTQSFITVLTALTALPANQFYFLSIEFLYRD